MNVWKDFVSRFFKKQPQEIRNLSAIRKDNLAVILIDMQPDYTRWLEKGECKRILPRHIEVIRFCAKTDTPLIVFEYEDRGETVDILQKEIKKVPRVKTLKKNHPNGFTNPKTDKILKQ